MKKLLCLFVITCMIISCGKKSAESSYIPKDAIGVMYINLESLSKKTDNVDFKSIGINEIIANNGPRELSNFMDEFMTTENIDATFRKEYILGFVSLDRMSASGGLIIPIKDGASFEKMIQPLIKETSGMQKEENVGKNNEFTVYSIDEVAIGWNNDTALIIAGKNYAATELTDLTELSSSDNIYATDYYKSFFDTNKDIGIHITSTPLANLVNSLASMFVGADLNLNHNNIVYYTNFEDDNIHTETKLKLNEDFQSILGYKSWMTKDYDASLLNAIPKDPSFLMKTSIDPIAMYKHVEGLQNNKSLPASIRSKLKTEFDQMNAEMKNDIGFTGEEFAGIFKGSMLFALTEGKVVKDTIYPYKYKYHGQYGSEEDEDEEPQYTVIDKKNPYMYGAIAIENKANFDIVLDKLLQEDKSLVIKEKGYIQLEKDLFLVVKDELLFITNNETKADELYANGKLTENLSGFEHKSKLSHSLYMYINPDFTDLYDDITPLFTGFSPYISSSNEANANKLYKEYFGENHYHMNVDGAETFTHTKGNENSLVTIIKYIDAMAKEYADIK